MRVKSPLRCNALSLAAACFDCTLRSLDGAVGVVLRARLRVRSLPLALVQTVLVKGNVCRWCPSKSFTSCGSCDPADQGGSVNLTSPSSSLPVASLAPILAVHLLKACVCATVVASFGGVAYSPGSGSGFGCTKRMQHSRLYNGGW
jgi:hypothetical protein